MKGRFVMKRLMRNIIPLLACFVLCFTANAQEAERKALENYLLQAVQEYNKGDFKKASSMFQAILNKDASDDAAHYYLGLCAIGLGDVEEGELHLSRAAALDSTNYWYRQRLAVLYSATKRTAEATAEYEKILRDFPKKNDTYYNLVELYSAAGRLDDALSIVDKIDTLQGPGEGTAMARFQILCQTGREQEAYDFLKTAKEDLMSPQIDVILGDYYAAQYNDSTALALYDDALEIAPNYAPAVLGKAEMFRLQRRYLEFFDLMDGLVKDETAPVDGKVEYLRALIQHGDPRFLQLYRAKIYGLFEACADTHPDSREAAMHDASVKNAFEDYEAMSLAGRKYSERFPDDEDFAQLTIYAEYQMHHLDEVLALDEARLEKIKKSGDKEKIAEAYTSVADLYHEMGQVSKAYKYYEQALKNNPDYAPALNNYAYFLSTENKKLKKAYNMSRKTTEQEPDNATYLDTFGWILHLMGKDTEALAVFKRVMIYGGKDSATVLEHYADVLEANGKKDLADMYRKQAATKEKAK